MSTFAVKAELPLVGYIGGALQISIGLVHDIARSTATTVPVVFFIRIRVRLLATIYVRCPEIWQPFNSKVDVLDHAVTQTPTTGVVQLSQLLPRLILDAELVPTSAPTTWPARADSE